MTQDEIDIMWQQAMQESIKDGEMFTRYHFAQLVTQKAFNDVVTQKAFNDGYEKGVAGFMQAVKLEREECWRMAENYDTGYEAAAAIRARGQA